jgi:hypothetical protein
MDYPGWTVTSTTHPVDPQDPAYCSWCAEAIGPAVAFAEDFGSMAFQSSVLDDDGGYHTVIITRV